MGPELSTALMLTEANSAVKKSNTGLKDLVLSGKLVINRTELLIYRLENLTEGERHGVETNNEVP